MLHNSNGQEVHLLVSVDVALSGFCAKYIGQQSLDGLLATYDRKFLPDGANTEKIAEQAIDDISKFMEKIETYLQDKEDSVFLMDIGDDQVSFGVMSVLLGSGKVKYAGLKQRVDGELFEKIHGICDSGLYYQIHSLETLEDPNVNLIVPVNQVSRAYT